MKVAHHIPCGVLKEKYILPVQNSSDSKVTQLYGTIFGQKNILENKSRNHVFDMF